MKTTHIQSGVFVLLCTTASPGIAGAEPFLYYPGTRLRPITCDFTCYRYRGNGEYHGAIDFGYPHNTDVNAAAAGAVEVVFDGIPTNTVGTGWGFGNHVYIRHANGYLTIYAHLLPGTIRVQRGGQVEAGALLGRSDNTGRSSANHLHFEVRDPQGQRVNPYGDPPDYTGGCGPNALWVTCPPTPAPPPDADGDGFTAAAGDCDDTNRDVHPGADESCNERDDDCNGTPDDPWRSGLAQDIGNPCTVGTGICANTGTWVCAPNGVTTVCSVDALPSQPESCNGLDDDCDGASDEDWRSGLAQDIGNPCTITWDTCRGSTSGTWTCAPDGRATVCDAPTPPGTPATAEICNGLDDDCNWEVDDLASAIVDPSIALRHHPSLAWNADREQFIVIWAEQPILPEVLGFRLRSRTLNALGVPIGDIRDLTSGTRFYSFGTDVAWNGSGYGVAWLATAPGGVALMYELLFVPLDADGIPTGTATAIAGPWGYTGDASLFASRVRIAARDGGFTVGAYTAHPVFPASGDIVLFRLSSTGEAVGEPISVLDPDGGDIVSQVEFALAVVDDQEIVLWVQNSPTGWNRNFMVGAWSDSIGRRVIVSPRYDGWRFGLGIACSDLRSCNLFSFMALLGGYWSELHALDAADMVVSPPRGLTLPPAWWDPLGAVVSCAGTTCSIAAANFDTPDSVRVMLASFRTEDSAITYHRTLEVAGGPTVAVRQGSGQSVITWSTSRNEFLATPWCAASD